MPLMMLEILVLHKKAWQFNKTSVTGNNLFSFPT
jgi:hypothetical protein